MALSPSLDRIQRAKRRLEREHGYAFTVLRASNGEVAILPVCRLCGRACIAGSRDNVHDSCLRFQAHIDAGGTLD